MEWLMTFLGFGFGTALGFIVCITVVCTWCWIEEKVRHEKGCPCPSCYKRRLKAALGQMEFVQQQQEIQQMVQRTKEAWKSL
jgi:hypothetical protein